MLLVIASITFTAIKAPSMTVDATSSASDDDIDDNDGIVGSAIAPNITGKIFESSFEVLDLLLYELMLYKKDNTNPSDFFTSL